MNSSQSNHSCHRGFVSMQSFHPHCMSMLCYSGKTVWIGLFILALYWLIAQMIGQTVYVTFYITVIGVI